MIFLALGLSLLGAQIRFQNHAEMWFGDGNDNPDVLIKDHVSVSYPISAKLLWEADNDLVRRDYKSENQNQRLYNSLQSSLTYTSNSRFAKASLRNTLFGDATALSFYPTTQALRDYEREMQNNAYLVLGNKIGKVKLRADGMLKALQTKRWEYELDLETFELERNRIADATIMDWNAGITAVFQSESGMEVFASYRKSEHDRDEQNAKQMQSSELGLAYSKKLFYLADIDAAFAWQNRQSDIIARERSNLYNSNFRIRSNISEQLGFSISYANHLCSDSQLNEILLISNYLRTHLKYSLDYDDSGASYLLAGAKYSPENDADAVFTDMELKLFQPFWLGAGFTINQDIFVEYNARSMYRLGVYNAISLNYRYRENIADPGLWRYIGIGVDYYY